MENDRSDSEEVYRSLSALLSPVFFDAGCGMLVGSFFLSVFFFFSFLPYSIPCVFTVLCPYTSGIFLFMCNYWSYIIGWVCLTMAKVLCPPSDLYMPVHSMCSNHCIAFNVSPPLWLSLRPAFRQPTLTCMKILLGMNDKKSWEKFVLASILFEVTFFFEK